MAELRTIKISIDLSGENETPVTPEQPKPEDMTDTNGKTKEGHTLIKSLILNQGYQTAKRLIIQGVDAQLNRHFALNEDYMGETTYNNAKNLISKITSVASSVGSGAMFGFSAGGGVGAVVGAGITAVGIGVSDFISIQAKMSSYYRNINASNIEVAYARQRAGLIDGSKGTEN